jgi:hypothetical protein
LQQGNQNFKKDVVGKTELTFQMFLVEFWQHYY